MSAAKNWVDDVEAVNGYTAEPWLSASGANASFL